MTELPPDIQAQIGTLEMLPEDEIDTTDVPEIPDWSDARRGVFYDSSQEMPRIVERGAVMDRENKERIIPTKDENDAFLKGVDRAMRRAAIEARQRAIDNEGYVETWRDGKLVRDTEV